MNRLTIKTPKGAALKLDNPKTEKEAKRQLHDKYLVAISKLAQYEDTGLTPEEIVNRKLLTGWIPLKYNKEEGYWYGLPEDGQEVLVSCGKRVWQDIFFNDEGCYFDSVGEAEEGMAWMPLPEPYKEGE